jgi:hypothetical protein
MKKISNWSLVGYLIGGAFSIFSAIRYFVLYPDTDKAIVYILIGFIICSLAWEYNKQIQLDNSLSYVEDYLAEKK